MRDMKVQQDQRHQQSNYRVDAHGSLSIQASNSTVENDVISEGSSKGNPQQMEHQAAKSEDRPAAKTPRCQKDRPSSEARSYREVENSSKESQPRRQPSTETKAMMNLTP
jgi:hypothetical protein